MELPQATGYGFGKTVTEAGLFLLPTTVMMLVFGPLSGLLDRRYGPKLPLTMGAVLATAAFALPAISHVSIWQVVVSGLLTGAGMGLAFAAMSNAIIENVPATHTGEATSVNSIVRTIGGSIGTAVIAAVIASNSNAEGVPTDQAFTAGLWICAAVAVLAVVAALLMPKSRRSSQSATDPAMSPAATRAV